MMEVWRVRSGGRVRRGGRLCCYDVRGRVRAVHERRIRRRSVRCRARSEDAGEGERDDENLDWEPEKRRAMRRANRKTPAGTGFEREAIGAKPARPRFALRNAAERMPLEDVNGSDSRRKTIAVVAAVAAGIAFVANGTGGSSNGGNDLVSQELDLYMSEQGVVFGRTSLGDYIEFFKDDKGNPVVRDQQGNVYEFQGDESDQYMMEMLNRDGDAVFVPPEYIRKISALSKTYSEDIVSKGDVDVVKAPKDISLFEENGGILVPAEESDERRRIVNELMKTQGDGEESNTEVLGKLLEEGVITEDDVKDELKSLQKALDEASKSKKAKGKTATKDLMAQQTDEKKKVKAK